MGRYQAYPEYKDSGVEWLGDIPAGWSVSKLKHVASIHGRIGFRGYTVDDIVDEGEGAIVLSPSNIDGDTFDLNKKVYLSWFKYYESPEIMVNTGDVLLVKTGSTYGKSAIIRSVDEPMTINPQMAILKNSKIDSRYLAYLMSSSLIRAKIDISNTGSGMPTMTQENINNFPIPHPKDNLDMNIADFLDHETTKIDTLIERQQQLIQLLKEKRQAVISHAVIKGLNPNASMKDSGVEWLGEVPSGWSVVPIKRVCEVKDGTHDTPQYVDPSDESFPLITSKDFDGENISFSNAKYISEADHREIIKRSNTEVGDVLMSMIGGNIGKALIVKNNANFSIKNVALFKTSGCEVQAKFILYYLQSGLLDVQISLLSRGGAQGFLSLSDLRNLVFFKVPREELNAIIEYLNKKVIKFDTLITKAESAIAVMQERRTALISAAVTGKIDVRNWQAPQQ